MINKSKEVTYFESFEANHYSYDTIYSTNMTGNFATFAIDGTRKVAITLPKSILQKRY